MNKQEQQQKPKLVGTTSNFSELKRPLSWSIIMQMQVGSHWEGNPEFERKII